MLLHLPVPLEGSSCLTQVPVAEVTFVDDQLYLLESGSPAGLDLAVGKLLQAITTHFPRNGFSINWKPGKTEAMLVYVGRNAKHFYDNRLLDGKVSVELPPGAGAQHITVVKSYKHLGGVVSVNGTVAKEAARRSKQGGGALKAMIPKLLRSKEVPAPTKLSCIKAYSQSRLLYNAHTWTQLPASAVRTLESVYMRGLRSAMGMKWGQVGKPPPNQVVLQAAGAPSVECILRRRRLMLFARALWYGPSALVALMLCRPRDVDLPWMRLLRNDLTVLRAMDHALSSLPDPAAELTLESWVSLIRTWPSQWKAYVARHFSTDSTVAPSGQGDVVDCAENRYQCNDCATSGRNAFFRTQKALDQHARKLHDRLCAVKDYIDADGRCPACEKTFASRLRCVAHLTDRRRGEKCKTTILSGAFLRLPSDRLEKLDAADSAARKAARVEGHTQPLVPGSRR